MSEENTNASCGAWITKQNFEVGRFDETSKEEQEALCEGVREGVAKANGAGKRSFEFVVDQGFDKNTCVGDELQQLNKAFFQDLYIGKCRGTPTKFFDWRILAVILVALLIAVVSWFTKLLRFNVF